MTANGIVFGAREEWEAFRDRHLRFLEKHRSLAEACHKIFIRVVETDTPSDRVVFNLGRLAVEDFNEILLLCGNGCGIGGMKLLRGLYEKAVTLGYISKYPTKAEQFLEYHYVHQGKHYNHAKKVFSMEQFLSPSQIREIEVAYKEAKQKYQETLCKKCGTTRTRMSWSELDLLSMSREAGLERLYLQCYYDPTLQAHTTVSSLVSRLRLKEDGRVTFEDGAQREKSAAALIGAHNLILYVLDIENRHFKMALENEIQDRFADFLYIWKTK